MPRVLLTGFCAVPGPRRAGVQLRHVIRALTSAHNVDLLVLREGEQGYVERQGSVRVLRVPVHEEDLRSQIQAFQRALRRQLDGADYDIVHCRDSWSCIPVLEARERHGFAVVYDLARSPLGETTGDAELDAQYGRDEEACLLAADMILAPTPAAVKALESRGKPGRVMLSPPGVDVDRFDWEAMPKQDIPRILYAGTLDPGRGVRVLVRAFAAILREMDARLVLAGATAPKFEATLRETIRELGITDKCEVVGAVDHDQLPALIATASVCVVPAAADLSPNPLVLYPTKLLEYGACKRAIVAPKRDTVVQVVENNHEALLFEPGDPIDLARKVLRVLGEPMIRDRLAANAYDRVRREFTASASRRLVRAAYDELVERFSGQFSESTGDGDESPKVEMLADDDFEATVFEEAPAPPPNHGKLVHVGPAPEVDTSVSVQVSIEADDHDSSSEMVAAPPSPRGGDETQERAPVAPKDDWVVTNVALSKLPPVPKVPLPLAKVPATPPPTPPSATQATATVTKALGASAGGIEDVGDGGDGSDDGTPVEGVAPAPGVVATIGDASFVAGEIDVPTPPPERKQTDRDRDRAPTPGPGDELVAVEFSAAGAMLGQPDADPDTGSRTPPLERR